MQQTWLQAAPSFPFAKMRYDFVPQCERQVWLVLASSFLTVFLVACGGGETTSSEPLPEPSLQPAQIAYTAEDVSSAESVIPIEVAESPTQAINAPPPKEGPPPKAPPRLGTNVLVENQAVSAVTTSIKPHIVRQVVATELSFPTDLALSSDADLIYTERSQGVVVKRAVGTGAVVWTPSSSGWGKSATLSSVAIDPDFSTTRVLYVLLLEPSFERAKADLVRLKLKNDLSGVVEQRVVLTTTYAADTSTQFGTTPQMGGKVRVGPDGFLYVAMGDFRSGAAAQSPTLLAGKVLRITANGQPAPGNRNSTGADRRIYVSGVRGPTGISFQPNTEDLVLAQQGASSVSQLSVVKAGANGGWNPSCPGGKQGYCESAGLLPVNWRPVIGWSAAEKRGIAGIDRLRGQTWRDWKNALAVAFDQAGGIEFVKVDAGGQVTSSVLLLTGLDVSFGSIAEGPDGLYAVVKKKDGRKEIWKLING